MWRINEVLKFIVVEVFVLILNKSIFLVFFFKIFNFIFVFNFFLFVVFVWGKLNFYINIIDIIVKDDESFYLEVLDFICYVVKLKWLDVFVFEGGCGDNLGGLELEELGRFWMNGYKGFNFLVGCFINDKIGESLYSIVLDLYF